MPKPPPDAQLYFDGPAAFRDWLAAHHETATEVQVGYFKKHTGRPSLTWAESVDEALCYGWIDGVRHSVDEDRYTIRFTPRQLASTWSAVNIARVAELTAAGRMQPAGTAAFARRSAAKSGIYAYENRPHTLEAAAEGEFRRDPAAWAFFESQTPSYRRTAIWWIVSAKKDETRARRLATLIACSAKGQRITELAPAPKKPR